MTQFSILLSSVASLDVGNAELSKPLSIAATLDADSMAFATLAETAALDTHKGLRFKSALALDTLINDNAAVLLVAATEKIGLIKFGRSTELKRCAGFVLDIDLLAVLP